MKWIISAFLAASLSPSLASAQGCDAWLLPDFWLRAGAVEVVGCEGRRVDERDENGASAMHLAAGYGFSSAVNALALRDPESINAVDDRGYTPLHYAAELNANPEMVSALLALGADVNHQQFYGHTPLMVAIFNGAQDKVFTLLIAAGADVFAVDDFGQTAMHVAAFQPNNIKMVERLLTHGANINDLDYARTTPLHMAASGENAAMITALLSLGANPATPTAEGKYPYDLAMDNNVMQGTEALDLLRNAITPPPTAPEICRFWPSGEFWFDITLEKVEACLPYVNINARGHYDETPLMWALMQPDVDIAVIRALLSVGPELGLGDIAGSTALHYAASGGPLEMLALLLSRGANPNAPDEAGQTPLHRATVRKADTPAALLLLAYGADPDIWDHEGRSAGDTEVEFQPDSAGN